MIFAKSRRWPSSRQDEILAGLEAYINRVRATKTLRRETVVRALADLGDRVRSGEFDALIAAFAGAEEALRYKNLAAHALSRENIEERLRRELGRPHDMPGGPARTGGIRTVEKPLGTLFHIAAGNMDGLPALSVAEGLLTGNFNILKLPQADGGLTVEILEELCRSEPEIGDFVAVFDTPSSDVAAMEKMAAQADGIVVWGGEEAVRGVRALAPAGAKLIEWGHRLGFAYVSGDRRGVKPELEQLAQLAEHIAVTKQLLCSSCQTIFLDTEDMEELEAFGGTFLTLLDEAMARHPAAEFSEAAARSIRARVNRMEAAVRRMEKQARADKAEADVDGRQVYAGAEGSVTVCRDSALELSPLYGSVLVKRLPEKCLLPVLRTAKGRLQTASLICPEEDRERLTDILIRAGVTRVTRAGHMSEVFPGEAHDGEYPLRRYVRYVDVEE